MSEKITLTVIQLVADKLGIEPDRINLSTSFADDLGSDPLDTEEIIEEVEKLYNLTIPEEDLEKLTTVGEIVAFIEKHAKRK